MDGRQIANSPFLRLLIPLVFGILFQYYLKIGFIPVLSAFIIGIIILLSSFIVPYSKEYLLRWIFGVGFSIILIALGASITNLMQKKAEYNFSDNHLAYSGIITDIPKVKMKSVACEVKLIATQKHLENKKIVCYFQPDGVSKDLQPGDEIRFYGKIEPFKNAGNPGEFNYKKFMYNKGFSGTIYLPTNRWEPAFKKNHSIQTYALAIRSKILDFYKSLNLSETQESIIAALTLGYKDNIPENIKESFRTTGTAHVLAVSGLHVGIIFTIIMFLFKPIGRKSKLYTAKFLIIILFLWIYAFITGFSPSVIRACIMLSMFCVAEILGKSSLSYNTIFAACFLILAFQPFSLFDVGFQLSFVAVFFIKYLNPKLSGLFTIRNKIGKNIWQLFTLSLSAQIGTLPLCLFYFGYFPTYFFITNIIIPPLVGFCIYLIFGISIISLLPFVGEWFVSVLILFLKCLIEIMTEVMSFFEHLPFAKIADLNISLISVFLLFSLIFTSKLFFQKGKAVYLQLSLCIILILILVPSIQKMQPIEDILCIHNVKNNPKLTWNIGNNKYEFTPNGEAYKIVTFKNKKLLSLNANPWHAMGTQNKYPIDYLHLATGNLSVISLSRIFDIETVILDASLSWKERNSLIKECDNLNIKYYNISESGAFYIK